MMFALFKTIPIFLEISSANVACEGISFPMSITEDDGRD